MSASCGIRLSKLGNQIFREFDSHGGGGRLHNSDLEPSYYRIQSRSSNFEDPNFKRWIASTNTLVVIL